MLKSGLAPRSSPVTSNASLSYSLFFLYFIKIICNRFMKYSLNIFHTTVVVLNFGKNTHARSFDPISKQECIPVGCVPPALSACWDTPPGCGPGDTPRCGPGDTPPRVWAWKHPPPDPPTSPLGVDLEFLTHASENITLPQTSFAGGKHIRCT